jgi:hypothetical protein
MFLGWRVKLREAQLAYRRDQLDEASRLLADKELRDFLPAKRLMVKVAGQLARRAQSRIDGGQTLAGWRDLGAAALLGADDSQLVKLREKMLSRMLVEVEDYVSAGDYRAALARLDELENRHACGAQTRRWRQVAQRMAAAQRLARRGRFAEAEQELAAALPLAEQVELLHTWIMGFRAGAAQLRELSQQLHQALADHDWQQVLERADAILDVAPDDRPARDARRQAWEAVGMRLSETSLPAPRPFRVVRPMTDSASNAAGGPLARGDRFLLWVDAVGAFLVCLGNEITLGQPDPGCRTDVALLADLSRVHAKIRREGEDYLLEPLRGTRVAGREAVELTALADKAAIQLGGAVRLVFRKPHPLSATARLDFASHHRTQPSADGVILMAESCVLGPAAASHIVCPHWSSEVVLCRQGNELACRAPGAFTVDGRPVQQRAVISRSSAVSGSDFSFTLEPL